MKGKRAANPSLDAHNIPERVFCWGALKQKQKNTPTEIGEDAHLPTSIFIAYQSLHSPDIPSPYK